MRGEICSRKEVEINMQEKKSELKYGENFTYEMVIAAILIGTFIFGATYQANEIFINQIYYWVAFVVGTMFMEIFVVLIIKSIARSLNKSIGYIKEGKNKAFEIIFVILILTFTILIGLASAELLGIWGRINLETVFNG